LEATSQNTPQTKAQMQRWVSSTWRFLHSPRLTIGLIVSLIVVGLLGWLLPPSTTPAPDGTAWIASLPPWLQPWGEPLFFLGFARLFQSLWFWGPLALLLLNSLVALADYGPGSRQRLSQTTPSIFWQHPLTRRVEHVARLPKSPDAFLSIVQDTLQQHGFFIYQSDAEEERLVGAVRRRWAWLGLPAIYLGLSLLVVGLLVSHYWLQLERLTLAPFESRPSQLFAGKFELSAAGTGQSRSQILFFSGNDKQPTRLFNWSLFQPGWFRGTLILPVAGEPVLTVEVRDAAGALRRLIPIQEDLPPAERLNLPLAGFGEPLYFLIPSAELAVQILPDPDTAAERYTIQVRRGSETSPSASLTAQSGQSFELDDLAVTLAYNRNLTVVAYRDPALLLYVFGLVLLVLGALGTFLYPPVQVWLVPEVKGIGGRLYAVLEKFGPVAQESQFLEQLLAPESPGIEDNSSDSTADEPQATPSPED
jgi:hypothetical protein